MAHLIGKLKSHSCLLRASSQTFQAKRNLRGKAPEKAKTFQQRLEEISRIAQPPELHYKVNIGLPYLKQSRSEEFNQRNKILKERRSQLSAHSKIDLDSIREEWLKNSGPFDIKNLAEHFNIFEDLFGEAYFIPRIPLQVHYEQKDGSALPVYFGNQIKPSEAVSPPKVTFHSDSSSMWSLVLTNPDGHFTDPNSEYLHWFIGNIPGNDVEKGEEVMSYLQPFPPRGIGSQRFIFLLFKQEGKIDLTRFKKVSPCLQLAERTFQMKQFYKEMQDVITPAGLSFFQCDWDQSLTNFFHNVLNMKEPIYEFDFPEPYRKPPVWFPKRQPFNLYMDKHRDPKKIAYELLTKRLKNVDPFKPKDPEPKYPNAFPEDTNLPSWLRVEIRKQRLKWGRYSDM